MVLVAPFGLWDDSDPVADPFGTTLSVQRADAHRRHCGISGVLR